MDIDRRILGQPGGVTQSTLLRFENEFGNYVLVTRMYLETPNGPVLVPGGYYLSETLHRLRCRDSYLIYPPEHDERLVYFLKKLYAKCVAMEAQRRYENAKERLRRECRVTLTPPTRKQKKFVKDLRKAAEQKMQDYQEFLRPEVEAREERQRRENDRRFAEMDAVRPIDAL